MNKNLAEEQDARIKAGREAGVTYPLALLCGAVCLSRCACKKSCTTVHYCSRACQLRHRSVHKLPCKSSPICEKNQELAALKKKLAEQEEALGGGSRREETLCAKPSTRVGPPPHIKSTQAQRKGRDAPSPRTRVLRFGRRVAITRTRPQGARVNNMGAPRPAARKSRARAQRRATPSCSFFALSEGRQRFIEEAFTRATRDSARFLSNLLQALLESRERGSEGREASS